ncbi:HepA Superfamily II DNA/RNA helicases, SNF2 family [uncultured Caudovirales phage]|uniref:HepA Superfamily II DNA/RNA helicases, SNF2 family n=1 Tax=uncultured Caudovirales phage TaxID=2100421 RepID=A0A6J5SV15_9CAUD|nr:HepA Superfamily II DNA/RNA helicases, SNF2 family [uncultured Caudovirales phage]
MIAYDTPAAYILEFPFSRWIITKIKEIPGWHFSYSSKQWSVPKNEFSLSKILKMGFKLDTSIAPEKMWMEIPLPELKVELDLKGKLMPFQEQGVAYMLEKQRVYCGDEMGTGKTFQAIAAMAHVKEFPCLVICPNSLKNNWVTEVQKWTGYKAMILTDQVRTTWPRFHELNVIQFFIVNPESLKKFFVQDIERPEGKPLRLNHIKFNPKIEIFKSLVIDEAHVMKEGKNLSTKIAMGIAKGKQYKILLSGTSIINRPKDLLAPLYILDRLEEFGGYKGFTERYCAGKNKASNLRELGTRLRATCFIQRFKKDVMKDLPPKTRTIIECELDPVSQREYDECEANLAQYLHQFKSYTPEQITKAMRGEVMVRITKLKMIAGKGKMHAVLDWAKDTTDEGNKLVLWAEHREVLAEIKRNFPEVLLIHGDVSTDDRNKAMYEFQKCGKCGVKLEDHINIDHEHVSSDAKLMALNFKTGGVGLTLTASSINAFIEYPYHAALSDQAEDRQHRKGQRDNVTCIKFIAKGTIDDWSYDIIETKRAITKAVYDDDEVIQVDIISSLMNRFNFAHVEEVEEENNEDLSY